MSGLVLVTPPTQDLVSLAEARTHVGITHTYHDARLAGLIVSAREWAQAYTARIFSLQTFDLYLDGFPAWIRLPVLPVAALTSIMYFDADGASQTLAAAGYEADLLRGVIRPADAWPATDGRLNAVVVRFDAGLDTYHPVQDTVREAMLLHVEAHYWRDPQGMPLALKAAEALLAPVRRVFI